VCSVDFPLDAYAHALDDDIEAQLANIPCDRI
jgi:hypothetical protein